MTDVSEQSVAIMTPAVRAAYADAVSGLRYIELEYGRLAGVGWDRVFDAFDALVTIPEREGIVVAALLAAPRAGEGVDRG